MERNSQNSPGYKLESQIREAYGRIVYTETCHNKKIENLLNLNNRIKLWQIILSAISTGGFIGVVFSNEKLLTLISSVVSLLLLILNVYAKNFNLISEIEEHKKASDILWKIREEYVSLLTDFDFLTHEEIIKKRDDLQKRTNEVYKNSPRTDKESYREAQKALKTEQEQTFSEHEIDVMLPNSIRRNMSKYF